jgi:DNA-directed RNA polymerase subunit RPC12/RpoP
MDPTDGYIYNEFLDPGMEYECPNCGTSFGREDVAWDDQTQSQVAVCPGCGQQIVMDEEEE